MRKSQQSIEFYPDAMERFERAAKVVAKSPPQHRKAKSKPKVSPKKKKEKTTR